MREKSLCHLLKVRLAAIYAARKAGLGKNIKQLTNHRNDDKKITAT